MKADEIKRLRTGLKLTQVEFAKRLGVGRVTLVRWETGVQEPSPLAVMRIRELQKRAKHWLPEQDSNLQPSG